jgi:subtilase family serine protease
MHPQRFIAVAITLLLLNAAPSKAELRFAPLATVIPAATSSAAPVEPCETNSFDSIVCYAPKAVRAAYGLNNLINSGLDGTRQTIVILNAFGSPSALDDLKGFDARFGLPDPPSFNVVKMAGTPDFNPGDFQMINWALETSLDVQWAHAIAPNANIVLVEAASNSASDLLAGLNYAIDRRLGNVISLSFGVSELSLANADGQAAVQAWEQAFRRARRQRMTVFAAAGDQGSTNAADEFGSVFATPNVNYPASSPNVTAVGGTKLRFGIGSNADPNGAYVGESVWNSTPDMVVAGGGGISALFRRPDYQDDLPSQTRKMLGNHRGIPDVAFGADPNAGFIVYIGGLGLADPADPVIVMGGTSAGVAQWAGVIADVNEAAHHPLGFINHRLYAIGSAAGKERDQKVRGPYSLLFHDVTTGDNAFRIFDPNCFDIVCSSQIAVSGFSAGTGWDLATGWGTPNVMKLSLIRDWDNDEDDHDDRR